MSAGDYQKSLKLSEAEELLDRLIYRPAGFLVAIACRPLPVTPNQVTILSMAAGLAAAWSFTGGTRAGLAAGACWYAAANVLDCADGQLARLRGGGSRFGRLVDGAADYISTIAIFLALGLTQGWALAVAGGFSSALHAIVFDRVQGNYIAAAKGEGDFTEREARRTGEALTERPGGAKAFFLRSYLAYLALQQGGGGTPVSRRAMRLWSFLGPTTNRSLLIGCALAGRTDLYLWGVIIAGNCWLLVCLAAGRRPGGGKG